MKHYYPNAQIVAISPMVNGYYYDNNTLDNYNDVMCRICEHYNISFVDLSDSVTLDMLQDVTHPNNKGMDKIKDSVISIMLNDCKLDMGENITYTVTHELENVKASLGYYKGVSLGASFIETLSSNHNINLTVTMGGIDITKLVYKDGTITINQVNGDIRIKAIAHNYLKEIVEPTCTEEGYTIYTCECGDSYIDDYTEALGHDYDEWYVVEEATCTKDGLRKHECKRCDVYDTSVITKLGHIEVIDKAVHPTCLDTGLTEGSHCERCSKVLTEQKLVNALGHSFTNYISDNNATCTKDGTKTSKCDRCDVFDTVLDKGSMLRHNLGEWFTTVEPGCETKGEQRRECSNCEYYETKVINEKGHSYSSKVTNPTCTSQGYTTYTCSCGQTYKDNYVDSLGHNYGEWYVVEEVTCTKDGLRKHECTRCDAYETSVITKLGHIEVIDKAVDPTCTITGLSEGKHCDRCKEVLIKQEVVKELGHSFTNYISDNNATCLEDGTKTSKCDRCEELDEVIDKNSAKGHTYDTEIVDPTCTEQGYTVNRCECGDRYVNNYTEALGHSLGEWKVIKNPTEEDTGLEIRRCENCEYEEERALDRIFIEGWKKNSTGWWYQYDDGSYPYSCWKYIDNEWYYFNQYGYMLTGWLMYNGEWYYLESSGAMAIGWKYVNGYWYYMNNNGAMMIGWIQDGGTWYYLNKDGAMQTGWEYINGYWYYMDSSGAMKTGWLKLGNKWYYLDSSGAMVTGTKRINGVRYKFKSSGEWIS